MGGTRVSVSMEGVELRFQQIASCCKKGAVCCSDQYEIGDWLKTGGQVKLQYRASFRVQRKSEARRDGGGVYC